MENLEVQAQDSSSPEIEETNQSTQDSHNQHEAQAKSDAERNFANMRKENERLARENNDYKKKYEESLKKPHRSPDDLAEIRDIEDVRREVSELRLRAKYNDIDAVLSSDNIAKLNEADPDMAQIIASMPDDSRKAVAAYKYIKKLGLDAPQQSFAKEKEALELNASKPKSSASVGKGSPLSEMNSFVENPDEYRKRLYREMVSASQNK